LREAVIRYSAEAKIKLWRVVTKSKKLLKILSAINQSNFTTVIRKVVCSRVESVTNEVRLPYKLIRKITKR
jgi:hypothetical protein